VAFAKDQQSVSLGNVAFAKDQQSAARPTSGVGGRLLNHVNNRRNRRRLVWWAFGDTLRVARRPHLWRRAGG
jgi:hypothetical protein